MRERERDNDWKKKKSNPPEIISNINFYHISVLNERNMRVVVSYAAKLYLIFLEYFEGQKMAFGYTRFFAILCSKKT